MNAFGPLKNLFTKTKTVCLIRNCSGLAEISFEEEVTKPQKPKKYTIIERSFSSDFESFVVEKQKDATAVKKKLNWEFQKLYGPVQNSKNHNYSKRNIEFSNRVIQNKPSIPLPCKNEHVIEHTSTIERLPLIRNESCNELSEILSFPMMNKTVKSDSKSKLVQKLSSLKESLEARCGSVFPSISKILQKTMSKESAENLRKWEEKMILEMGEEEFWKHKKEMLANGSALHANINDFLTSVPEEELTIGKGNAGHWKSLKSIFPKIEDVKLVEERVSHPFLCYKGVVDCFARYRGHLVVIDWKTSKKKKNNLNSTFDNPLQVAAYVGALNFDPRFQYLANKGLIVVAYENGDHASAHFIDELSMKRYWNDWLQRVNMFWQMED